MSAPPVRGDMVAFRYRGPLGRYRASELIGVVRDFYVEQSGAAPFVSKDPPFMFLSDYRLRYVVELTLDSRLGRVRLNDPAILPASGPTDWGPLCACFCRAPPLDYRTFHRTLRAWLELFPGPPDGAPCSPPFTGLPTGPTGLRGGGEGTRQKKTPTSCEVGGRGSLALRMLP